MTVLYWAVTYSVTCRQQVGKWVRTKPRCFGRFRARGGGWFTHGLLQLRFQYLPNYLLDQWPQESS